MRNPLNSFNTTLIAAALSLTLGACGDAGSPGTPASAPNAPLQNAQGANNPLGSVVGNPATPASEVPDTSLESNTGSPANDTPTGSTVTAGSEFSSAAAGVRMRMPNSIIGRTDASGTLQFNNEQNTLGGIVFGGSAGGGQAGISRGLRTFLPLFEREVGQVFSESENTDGTAVSFLFSVAGTQLIMQLDVRQGPNKNYVAVLGNSGINDQSELSAIVSEMSNSVVFTAPTPPALKVNMSGIVLTENSSVSSNNSSGSLNSSDEGFLVTCNTGEYEFFSKSFTSVNFSDGSSGGTSGSTSHVGLFSSHVDFAGNQLISLHSTDQGTFVFNVTPLDGAVFLDEEGYQLAGTSEQQCP